MSLETLKKVVEWLPSNCDVFFAGYGEPLLHKDLLIFIQKLSEKGVGVSVLTNGKLLSPQKIKDLFKAGLERIQISILLRDELAEIKKYADMAAGINDKIRFNLIYEDIIPNPDSLIQKLQQEKGFEFYYKKVHNRGNELYQVDYKEPILSCGTFFIDSYIDTNGSLQVCSNDINGKYNLGNIFAITFDEYKEKKKQYLGNKQIIPICQYCTDEYRLKHFKHEEK
jgi:MoaA/NifB/PqqE/SkfB family radical SAM enzyme